MIDMLAGRIAFVIVTFGGFLGISDKWFALPWVALTTSQSGHQPMQHQ